MFRLKRIYFSMRISKNLNPFQSIILKGPSEISRPIAERDRLAKSFHNLSKCRRSIIIIKL